MVLSSFVFTLIRCLNVMSAFNVYPMPRVYALLDMIRDA